MLDTTFNQKKADTFIETMVDVLNKSAIALTLSIGHRAGLFDVMAEMPEATSQQIADKAGLNERYVREWLGTLVTGRVVNYFPESKTYQLPAEHAGCLTTSANPNIAATMQFVPLLASVEDEVLVCFRNGGGVPYSEFPRFHQVMAEESAQTVVAALEVNILPLICGIKEKLKRGIDVLDVGCGSGRAMIKLAETYPNSQFAGYDFSEEAVDRARSEAAQRCLKNVHFEVRDAADIGETENYDLITAFDAIHDQAKPAAMLKSIEAALRPDGRFLAQDISGSSLLEKNYEHPVSPFLYTISYMHCMTVSLANNGAGLGTMWGEETALEMLQDAGFSEIAINRLDHDFMNVYYVSSKG
jgi:2-polyprenyl-3-methyl-5-hydroxy-6-metoxy-1,4-benzoquinol methylase